MTTLRHYIYFSADVIHATVHEKFQVDYFYCDYDTFVGGCFFYAAGVPDQAEWALTNRTE